MGKRDGGEDILIDSTGLPNSIHFPLTAISNHNGKISNKVGCWRPSILTRGDCGQNPRLFLRRKRVLAKYTKEEKQKAIDLYIRYCKQATKIIKELESLIRYFF